MTPLAHPECRHAAKPVSEGFEDKPAIFKVTSATYLYKVDAKENTPAPCWAVERASMPVKETLIVTFVMSPAAVEASARPTMIPELATARNSSQRRTTPYSELMQLKGEASGSSRGAARRVPSRPAFDAPTSMHFFRSLYSFLVSEEADEHL